MRFLKIAAIGMSVIFCGATQAQKDVITKKNSTQLRCKVLKESTNAYTYAYINNKNKVSTQTIKKAEVDTVQYNFYPTNLISNKLLNDNPAVMETPEETIPRPFRFSVSVGLSVGNILEFNSPSGGDKKSFNATSAIDLGADYAVDGKRFAMTNELHWTFAIQKSGVNSAARLQRATDDLNSLHDFSEAIGKKRKWNINLIAKFNTSIFNIYDGDYFKDYNNLGKIQGFLNPYELILSPGLKYQPNDYLRISISPYSVRLYGLRSQQVANTGYYTKTVNGNGDYDRFLYEQLGAEINIWYDQKIKQWLEFQYRLGVSSDYFSKLARNGLVNGLFITKVRLIKNVHLSHRASLKGSLGTNRFKPFYTQTILLSYSKSF